MTHQWVFLCLKLCFLYAYLNSSTDGAFCILLLSYAQFEISYTQLGSDRSCNIWIIILDWMNLYLCYILYIFNEILICYGTHMLKI